MTEERLTKTVTTRLTDSEFKRLEVLLERAQKNNYVKRSEILRELIGVVPPKIITDKDRKYLSGDGVIR